MIEYYYKTTIKALKIASNTWIPMHKKCATKFGWDQSMQELKQRAAYPLLHTVTDWHKPIRKIPTSLLQTNQTYKIKIYLVLYDLLLI